MGAFSHPKVQKKPCGHILSADQCHVALSVKEKESWRLWGSGRVPNRQWEPVLLTLGLKFLCASESPGKCVNECKCSDSTSINSHLLKSVLRPRNLHLTSTTPHTPDD